MQSNTIPAITPAQRQALDLACDLVGWISAELRAHGLDGTRPVQTLDEAGRAMGELAVVPES